MARLSVVINNEKHAFALTDQGLNIGRLPDNDIILNHAIVSRRHAHIELRRRRAWVYDLNSRNGVFVNRLRIKEEQLSDGDVITIGPFDLQFEDRAAQSVVLDDSRYFPLTSDGRAIRSDELPASTLDLQMFYAIGMRLSQVVDFRELLDLVIEEMLRVVPAQRGFYSCAREANLYQWLSIHQDTMRLS